jgi:hypothetical protein
MRRSGLDGHTQAHRTKAREEETKKSALTWEATKAEALLPAASLSPLCGKRRRLGRKLVLKSVFFFLLRSVCLCALAGSFLPYREEFGAVFFSSVLCGFCAFPEASFRGLVLFFFLSPTLRCFGGFSGSFLPYQEELCVGRLRSAKQTIGRLMEKKR